MIENEIIAECRNAYEIKNNDIFLQFYKEKVSNEKIHHDFYNISDHIHDFCLLSVFAHKISQNCKCSFFL